MSTQSAKITMAKWGCPASVLIAQSAIETGWGSHVKDNSYFGIKTGSKYAGKSTSYVTHEVVGGVALQITANFRAYSDFADAADGYGAFMTDQFHGAFAFKDDPFAFLHYVATHGYATDPDYEKKVAATIRAHNLQALDRQ